MNEKKPSTLPCGALIFDLDGTLVNSLPDLAGAMNQVLGSLGFPGHPQEAYAYFVGDGMENLARRALPPEARHPELIHQATESLRREYGRGWRQATEPYPGIPELLRGLSRRRLPLAVLTNKPDELANRLVAAFFPEIPWVEVRGAAPGRPLKPHPAGAAALAERFALPPARVIVVGDSGVDMRTAVAAGMFPAGALWGFRPAEELQAAGALALLPAPAALLDLLD